MPRDYRTHVTGVQPGSMPNFEVYDEPVNGVPYVIVCIKNQYVTYIKIC